MAWRLRIQMVVGVVMISSSIPAVVTDDVTAPSDATDATLSHHINEFGYDLLRNMLQEHEQQNVVLGSASIAGLLGMILLGSVGETYDELATSLGFSEEILVNRQHHERFGALLQDLNSAGSGSRTLYADAVVLGAGVSVRPLYHHFLKRVYNADALQTNFTDNNQTRSLINDWVKEHTEGKIEEFLQQPLPNKTKLVLMSAHYFSGEWEKPFNPKHTIKTNFKKPSGIVQADLMLNMGHFNYVLSPKHGCHMIALPYKNSSSTMYVMKPLKTVTLPEMLNNLTWNIVEKLISQMQDESSVIRFPKMTLQSRANLKTSLKASGINAMFEDGKANFALMIEGMPQTNKTMDILTRFSQGDEDTELKKQLNMLPNPGLHIDTVLHEVQITIDEYGTEAAAVSAGILSRSAKLFYVDSPFYFFIKDEKTGLVTFSAAIYDPTSLM